MSVQFDKTKIEGRGAEGAAMKTAFAKGDKLLPGLVYSVLAVEEIEFKGCTAASSGKRHYLVHKRRLRCSMGGYFL